jgi:hypothetical protein
MVSGLAALIRMVDPELAPGTIKARLIAGADTVSSGDRGTWHRINACKTVGLLLGVPCGGSETPAIGNGRFTNAVGNTLQAASILSWVYPTVDCTGTASACAGRPVYITVRRFLDGSNLGQLVATFGPDGQAASAPYRVPVDAPSGIAFDASLLGFDIPPLLHSLGLSVTAGQVFTSPRWTDAAGNVLTAATAGSEVFATVSCPSFAEPCTDVQTAWDIVDDALGGTIWWGLSGIYTGFAGQGLIGRTQNVFTLNTATQRVVVPANAPALWFTAGPVGIPEDAQRTVGPMLVIDPTHPFLVEARWTNEAGMKIGPVVSSGMTIHARVDCGGVAASCAGRSVYFRIEGAGVPIDAVAAFPTDGSANSVLVPFVVPMTRGAFLFTASLNGLGSEPMAKSYGVTN